jgi:hypothetical protein
MNIYFINNQFGFGNVVISEDQHSEALNKFSKQVDDFLEIMKKQSDLAADRQEQKTKTEDLFNINKN